MQNFWTQMQPAVVEALKVLVPALVTWLVTLLHGKTAQQQQAVVGAMHAVEMIHGGRLAGPDKKEIAVNLASALLPAGLGAQRDKLGRMVEAGMPALRARFTPTSSPTADTAPGRPPLRRK